MLKELAIQNIAIIREERLTFDAALTVLSGETGAGKSIIIGAVGLIMGERSSRELIRAGEDKASVTALFDSITGETTAYAESLGIEIEGGLLLSREITAEGGSVARINGKPVSVSLLRDIATKLIGIHGQHASQTLLDEESHIKFLDAFADDETEKETAGALYEQAAVIKRQIAAITHDEQEKTRLCEMLRYQIADIDAVKPQDGEEEELKAKRLKLQNAEKLSKAAKLIYRALYQNEKGPSAYDLLEKAEEALGSLSGVMESASTYAETLSDFRYRLEDIADSVRHECDIGVSNPSEMLDKIEERLEGLRRLQKKYGNSAAEILAYREKMQKKLHALENADEQIEDCRNELQAIREKQKACSAKITEKRRSAARELETKITSELIFLDMACVRFHIDISPLPDYAPDGTDKITFLVSANAGEPLLPLSKVASGGELSRMMLALKCVFADKEHTETLIFDEIDTGISGRTSHKIGIKLKEVAAGGTQVLCVTHSPQIAALADTHLYVSKAETDGRTESSVRALDREERVREIARIIGGARVTEQTMAAAKELIESGSADAVSQYQMNERNH